MAAESVAWRNIAPPTKFAKDVEHHWRGSPYSLPIPGEELRATASGGDLGDFFAIGDAWAQIISRFLPPNPTVLDIGCNCGKIARFLYHNPGLKYIGVDVSLRAIEWCQRELVPIAGDRFRFIHADLHSETYNPAATIRAREYRFPVTDASVDMVVAASLFTHLLEPDCTHYLSEISRVLNKSGSALISIHIDVPDGQKYWGDEGRIDVEPTYFIGLAGNAGLVPAKIIGNVYGQQLILFAKP